MRLLDRIKCDIVLPVYNGLTYVRDCIASLLEYTPSYYYHLFVFDDCSDTVTNSYLNDQAAGANFFGMDELLQDKSPRDFPDVVTGVGFCMLLRRSALEEVGFLDEVYRQGYCEDSDLCMRLTSRGHRTVVADHVYVSKAMVLSYIGTTTTEASAIIRNHKFGSSAGSFNSTSLNSPGAPISG